MLKNIFDIQIWLQSHELSQLLDIALKSSRIKHQLIKANFCAISHRISTFIYVNKVAMKISGPLCAFCQTHHHSVLQKS